MKHVNMPNRRSFCPLDTSPMFKQALGRRAGKLPRLVERGAPPERHASQSVRIFSPVPAGAGCSGRNDGRFGMEREENDAG